LYLDVIFLDKRREKRKSYAKKKENGTSGQSPSRFGNPFTCPWTQREKKKGKRKGERRAKRKLVRRGKRGERDLL